MRKARTFIAISEELERRNRRGRLELGSIGIIGRPWALIPLSWFSMMGRG